MANNCGRYGSKGQGGHDGIGRHGDWFVIGVEAEYLWHVRRCLYGVSMTDKLPREVTSVLVEEGRDSVTVTWGLGEPVSSGFEYFGYGVDYYGADGNGGKRFGVRFRETTTAYVWDNASATQANYEADSVTVTPGSIVVHYRDADLGLKEIGTIAAFSQVDGNDQQVDLPVTLLR